MKMTRAFLLRLAGMFDKDRSERELRDELESHLEMRIEDHIRSGMPPDEARRIALIESGGLESAKEAYRDRRGLPLLQNFFQDCHYTLRTLRNSPGFTLTTLLILALGIGANTAIFSLVDAFLLRPLPVKNPQELVVIHRGFPITTYEQFRDQNHSFTGVFAYDDSHVTVTIDGQPDYVDGDFVSGNYFDVLGIAAFAGRTLHADDDRVGRQPAAVISYRYWVDRFNRQPAAIGKTVYLAGQACTIVGVTGPGFFGRSVAGKSADIVLPLFLQRDLGLKDHDSVFLMGRLRPGVSLQQARADLDVLYRRLATTQTQREVRSKPLELTSGIRGTSNSGDTFPAELRILAVVAGIALLIACVNIANLLLARASGRHREIAVRLSIGASRARLIRQLLTESIVLAMAGGALGLLFAKAGLSLLLGVLSYGNGPIPFDLDIDVRILAFTATISLLTGILFGLAPAWAASKVDLAPILKGGPRNAEARTLRLSTANILVVVQVALSLVLLIGSGLLIRTLRALHDVDFGFERENVVLAWVFPALAGYDHAKEMALYRDLPQKMSGIPGVSSASLLRIRMLRGGWYRNVWAESAETVPEQQRKVRCDPVGPRFFETMGIPLLYGREFSAADSETAPKVAVISEKMARKFFSGQNPIGLHIGFGAPATKDVRIVGIARDVRHRVPEDRPAESVYIPYTQATAENLGQMNLIVRTAVSPLTVVTAMRRELQSIDRDLPLVGVQTQAEEIENQSGSQRSLATLLSIFGTLALLLTAMGLYGTVSHAVGRRTKEIGIRMALGAAKHEVLWMVLRQALMLIVIGIAIGIPVAVAASRMIASMLFKVAAWDPAAIAASVLLMFVSAVLATWIPARRATRVDPMVALRYE